MTAFDEAIYQLNYTGVFKDGSLDCMNNINVQNLMRTKLIHTDFAFYYFVVAMFWAFVLQYVLETFVDKRIPPVPWMQTTYYWFKQMVWVFILLMFGAFFYWMRYQT